MLEIQNFVLGKRLRREAALNQFSWESIPENSQFSSEEREEAITAVKKHVCAELDLERQKAEYNLRQRRKQEKARRRG